jgi:hypothetical protein
MFEQAGIFGADFVNGEAIGLDRVGHSHVVTLEDGSAVTSHAVIIATGSAPAATNAPINRRRQQNSWSHASRCLSTKVLMVGRCRWSLGSRWSGRPHVLPGLRTADPAQHLLRHHRGVEVDHHSMRSVVVAFQAGDPFGVHPDPAAGEGEQLGLYGG